MNLSPRLNTAATKIALWTANRPAAMRLIMTVLPMSIAVFALIAAGYPIPTPPCGSGTGGSC